MPDDVSPIKAEPPKTPPGERPEERAETGSRDEADTGPTSDTAEPVRRARRRRQAPPEHISGIAVSQRDVFVAFGSGWSTGSKSKLYRFDAELENPLLLAEGLRACCQRCDITARDGVLYVAENSAHRVVLYDRDGQVLAKWGERGREGLETFGACCNPMNICFDGQGVLYTAESGLGRVKRYTASGAFVDLVGYVGTDRFWNGSGLAASCSNTAIAVSRDGGLVCLDLDNGLQTLWTADEDDLSDYCSFIAGNGHALFITQGGKLYLLKTDKQRFQSVATLNLFPDVPQDSREVWSHPALVGNRLYVRNLLAAYCFLLE